MGKQRLRQSRAALPGLGAVSQTIIRESSLFAEFDVHGLGTATVTLRTPPLTPVDGGALGIALRVAR